MLASVQASGGIMAGVAAPKHPAVPKQPGAAGPWPMRVALGRVCRWFFFGVVLAMIPIVISFAWLPKDSSITMLLSHGDLVAIAAALAGLSIGELIGPDEPPWRGLRNVLICSCVLLLLGSVMLLSIISGHNTNFSPGQIVYYSWLLLILTVVIGVASMGSTVSRD